MPQTSVTNAVVGRTCSASNSTQPGTTSLQISDANGAKQAYTANPARWNAPEHAIRTHGTERLACRCPVPAHACGAEAWHGGSCAATASISCACTEGEAATASGPLLPAPGSGQACSRRRRRRRSGRVLSPFRTAHWSLCEGCCACGASLEQLATAGETRGVHFSGDFF